MSVPLRILPAVGLAMMVLVGCDRQEDNEPAVDPPVQLVGVEPERHSVGQLAAARDYTMSVESVKECTVKRPFQPKRGFVKLGVKVTLHGTTNKEIPVNPFYASLRARDGETYSSTLAGCKPALEARRVKDGQTATGWITFEKHRNARDLEMKYAPMVIGVGREELEFDLGR